MFANSLIIAAAAVIAEQAWAGQEFGLINEHGLTDVGLRLLPGDDAAENSASTDCKWTAKKPGDHCYWRSYGYLAKSKEQKMSELWAEIRKDDEPMEYQWKDVPRFFT